MFTPKLVLFGLGILLLAFYLPALINPKKFGKELISTLSDSNTTRMLGLHILLISFILLSVHWKFTNSWLMVVSITGWLTFIKGILYLWSPETVKKRVKALFQEESTTSAIALLGIMLAIFYIYTALNLVELIEVVAG